jgi:hypothetical protein
MIQAFSLIFNFFNIASPCSDMSKTYHFHDKENLTLKIDDFGPFTVF